MSLLRTVLSILVLVLFFFLQFFALGLHALLGTLLSEHSYVSMLEETNSYERMAEFASQAGASAGIPVVLSSAYVKEQSALALSSLFRYLRSETESVEGAVSLVELKAQNPLLSALLPDRMLLSETVETMGLSATLADLRTQLSFYRMASLGLWIVLLLLLVSLVFLNYHPWVEALKWVMLALLASGIASLAVFAVFPSLLLGFVLTQIQSALPQEALAQDAFTLFLSPLLHNLVGQVSLSALVLAGAMAVLGGILFVVFVRERQHILHLTAPASN